MYAQFVFKMSVPSLPKIMNDFTQVSSTHSCLPLLVQQVLSLGVLNKQREKVLTLFMGNDEPTNVHKFVCAF